MRTTASNPEAINSVCVSDASNGPSPRTTVRSATVNPGDATAVVMVVATIDEVVFARAVVAGVVGTEGVVVGRALRPVDRRVPIATASAATTTNAATMNNPGRRGEPKDTIGPRVGGSTSRTSSGSSSTATQRTVHPVATSSSRAAIGSPLQLSEPHVSGNLLHAVGTIQALLVDASRDEL
jgi:hypothetical protein